MIEIEVTDAQREEAARRGRVLEKIPGSFTNHESLPHGMVGEVVVRDYCRLIGCEVIDKSSLEDDMRIDGKRVEVKSKRTTAVPRPWYEASVAAYNTEQGEWYCFVRVSADLRMAWIMGVILHEEYFERASHTDVGFVDPRNGWVCDTECWNLAYDWLYPLEVLKKEIDFFPNPA